MSVEIIFFFAAASFIMNMFTLIGIYIKIDRRITILEVHQKRDMLIIKELLVEKRWPECGVR